MPISLDTACSALHPSSQKGQVISWGVKGIVTIASAFALERIRKYHLDLSHALFICSSATVLVDRVSLQFIYSSKKGAMDSAIAADAGLKRDLAQAHSDLAVVRAEKERLSQETRQCDVLEAQVSAKQEEYMVLLSVSIDLRIKAEALKRGLLGRSKVEEEGEKQGEKEMYQDLVQLGGAEKPLELSVIGLVEDAKDILKIMRELCERLEAVTRAPGDRLEEDVEKLKAELATLARLRDTIAELDEEMSPRPTPKITPLLMPKLSPPGSQTPGTGEKEAKSSLTDSILTDGEAVGQGWTAVPLGDEKNKEK